MLSGHGPVLASPDGHSARTLFLSLGPATTLSPIYNIKPRLRVMNSAYYTTLASLFVRVQGLQFDIRSPQVVMFRVLARNVTPNAALASSSSRPRPEAFGDSLPRLSASVASRPSFASQSRASGVVRPPSPSRPLLLLVLFRCCDVRLAWRRCRLAEKPGGPILESRWGLQRQHLQG